MPERLYVRLRRYFISGFFTLIPIGLSVIVVIWLVRFADNTLGKPVDAAVGFHVPGLGILLAVLLTLLAGVVTSHVIGERLLEVAEEVFQRIPVYKWVYRTIKQMVEAFSPENKAAFRSVVVVEYPRLGAYSLGFVTNAMTLDLPDGTSKAMVSVYIPTNHVYFGEIVLFPKEQVIPTSISIQQGIQCSLSAGAAIPERLGPRTPTGG